MILIKISIEYKYINESRYIVEDKTQLVYRYKNIGSSLEYYKVALYEALSSKDTIKIDAARS